MCNFAFDGKNYKNDRTFGPECQNNVPFGISQIFVAELMHSTGLKSN